MYLNLGELLFVDIAEDVMRYMAIVGLFAIYGIVMVKIFGKGK